MAEALKRHLDGYNVNYLLHVVDGPTMTAREAASQLRVPLEMIIKSILFIDEKQAPVLAILTAAASQRSRSPRQRSQRC